MSEIPGCAVSAFRFAYSSRLRSPTTHSSFSSRSATPYWRAMSRPRPISGWSSSSSRGGRGRSEDRRGLEPRPVRRVVEEHREPRVARPHRLLGPIEMSRRRRAPHHRHVFVCVISVSLSRGGATAPPCCSDVLGAADRLTVGVTEMPSLPGLDEAADELPVDQLGALAGGTSSTAHPALSHDGDQPLRVPRAPGGAYFASSRRLPSHLHRGEQKR